MFVYTLPQKVPDSFVYAWQRRIIVQIVQKGIMFIAGFSTCLRLCNLFFHLIFFELALKPQVISTEYFYSRIGITLKTL